MFTYLLIVLHYTHDFVLHPQDQLEQKVTTGQAMPTTMTDNLLQQHYNQMEHLNQNMQRMRQAQERQLAERMKFMKKQKEQ